MFTVKSEYVSYTYVCFSNSPGQTISVLSPHQQITLSLFCAMNPDRCSDLYSRTPHQEERTAPLHLRHLSDAGHRGSVPAEEMEQ